MTNKSHSSIRLMAMASHDFPTIRGAYRRRNDETRLDED